MKKIIITGGNGFIGRALINEFIKKNYYVIAIIRDTNSYIIDLKKLKNVRIVYCTLENIDNLSDIISIEEYECFYHLAWQGVSDEDANNSSVQFGNVIAACKAVKVAKKLNCKKFVFASSIMEYEVIKLMQTDLKADLRNIYKTSKLSAHYYTKIIANNIGISYNAAIISNVFGPEEKSKRFINDTLHKMISGIKPRFTKGEQIYDFIYIDDAIQLLFLIGDKGIDNTDYYVGNMLPKPLYQYILEIRECFEENIDLGMNELDSYIGVSLQYNEFDMYQSKRDFNFSPQYSFKEGILKTIKWIKTEEDYKKTLF